MPPKFEFMLTLQKQIIVPLTESKKVFVFPRLPIAPVSWGFPVSHGPLVGMAQGPGPGAGKAAGSTP